MDESQGFDAEQLRARIHENARKRRAAVEGAASPEPIVLDAPGNDRGLLHASSDISSVRFVSHRTLLGPLIVLVKTVLRRLLTPILSQQAAYNAANIRMIDAGVREQKQLREELRLLSRNDAQAQEGLDNIIGEQTQIRDHLRALVQQQAELQENFRVLAHSQRQGEARLHGILGAEIQKQLAALVRQQAELSERLDNLTAQQTDTQEQLDAVAQRHTKFHDELHAIGQTAEGLATRQGQLETEVYGTHSQALQKTHEHIAGAERKLRRLLHTLADGRTDFAPSISPSQTMPPTFLDPHFDYAGFEERFRGSEEATKARQRVYLEQFKGRQGVVEVGCGRGEFLELLREAGVEAKGVDIDLDMVLYCQEKGLDVVREDAFIYLESLPDNSLGGVFAAQVIEHMETAQLTRLIRLCHRKLHPAGVLVLETLNPECLFVLYRWFWIDLTHTRLIHPETLKFLFESARFGHVECHFLPQGDSPLVIPPLEIRDATVPELGRFNAATDYLNKLLYGSSDYAIIGIK